ICFASIQVWINIYIGLPISRITRNKIVSALCEFLPTQHHLILTLK
uniref:Uncharacterized protein n=1 Tax=Aegilops tauschii subsp. strangulata TaxID=200361 RepID=A0A453K3U3_AEGTS